MIPVRLPFIALLFAVLVTACTPTQKIDNSQYWQRRDASEAAYTQGPKTQQMLNRDIARCVSELRELERIGVLDKAIPTDRHGNIADPDAATLRRLGAIERDGYLRAEDRPYHDFETCMYAKGWERIKFVPYDRIDRAQRNYLSTLGKRARKKIAGQEQSDLKVHNNYNVND